MDDGGDGGGLLLEEEEEECVDPVPPASGLFILEDRLQGGGGVWE